MCISRLYCKFKICNKGIFWSSLLRKFKESQFTFRSNILHHHFYLREVDMQVQNGLGELGSLLSSIHFRSGTSLLRPFWIVYLLQVKLEMSSTFFGLRMARGITRPLFLKVLDLFSLLDSPRNRFYHSSDPQVLAKTPRGPRKYQIVQHFLEKFHRKNLREKNPPKNWNFFDH